MIIQLAADLQDGAGRLLRASPSPPPSPDGRFPAAVVVADDLFTCAPPPAAEKLPFRCRHGHATRDGRELQENFWAGKNRPPGVLPSERLDVDFDSMIHV